MTDDLIDRLAQDLTPRAGRRVGVRLGAAVAVGSAATLAGVVLLLGLRPDMASAVIVPMFWMKLGYPLVVGIVATACVERLSRPVGAAGPRALWLAAPVLAVVVIALGQLAGAPAAARHALVMGGSAMICPWIIVACSAPVLAGLMWAIRGLAPTRLRAAGAAAGLAAGAFGATLYALHCTESGGAFLAIWYSLGMLAPALAGALAGPFLLRWR